MTDVWVKNTPLAGKPKDFVKVPETRPRDVESFATCVSGLPGATLIYAGHPSRFDFEMTHREAAKWEQLGYIRRYKTEAITHLGKSGWLFFCVREPCESVVRPSGPGVPGAPDEPLSEDDASHG